MGWQDFLYKLNITFESKEALELASKVQEVISYFAIKTSMGLAKEKGEYTTFRGSLWSQGKFPVDTSKIQSTVAYISREDSKPLDWGALKNKVMTYGLRNSNLMAIAPTATIANIVGCYPCIEPAFKNLYMKENLSGNFIVINKYLVDKLVSLNLWNEETLINLKINNGSIKNLNVPDDVKNLFKESFEISPEWFVDLTAQRQIWIDQAISTNIFTSTVSGKLLHSIYMRAWEKGLKTTYYLRTLGASQVTKTVETKYPPLGISKYESRGASKLPHTGESTKVAYLKEETSECEACQ